MIFFKNKTLSIYFYRIIQTMKKMMKKLTTMKMMIMTMMYKTTMILKMIFLMMTTTLIQTCLMTKPTPMIKLNNYQRNQGITFVISFLLPEMKVFFIEKCLNLHNIQTGSSGSHKQRSITTWQFNIRLYIGSIGGRRWCVWRLG